MKALIHAVALVAAVTWRLIWWTPTQGARIVFCGFVFIGWGWNAATHAWDQSKG